MKTTYWATVAVAVFLCAIVGMSPLLAMGKSITIQYYTLAWQPGVVKAVQRIVSEWNDANPDIQVKVVWGSWASVNEFLLTSFLAGDAPDIFHQDAVMCYEYGKLGFAAPLNAYLTEDELSDIPQWMWNSASDSDGNIYGYPFLVETQVIFYNRKDFQDAGIEIPGTSEIAWDQLLEYAKKLTVRDASGKVTRWGVMLPLAWEHFALMLVKQNGGNIVHRKENGMWYVKVDEAAREALRWYCDLVTRWHVMPVEAIGNDYTYDMSSFSQDRYSMLAFGCWNRRILHLWNTVDWGMLRLIGPVNDITSGGPQAYGVWMGSPHKEEAVRFLRYISSGQNLIDLAYPDWVFPAKVSLQSDPVFTTDENQWNLTNGWLKYSVDILPKMPTVVAFLTRVVYPELEQVLLGKRELDEAIDRIERNGNQYLRKAGLQ